MYLPDSYWGDPSHLIRKNVISVFTFRKGTFTQGTIPESWQITSRKWLLVRVWASDYKHSGWRAKRLQRCGEKSLLSTTFIQCTDLWQINASSRVGMHNECGFPYCQTYRSTGIAFVVWQAPFRELLIFSGSLKGKLTCVKHIELIIWRTLIVAHWWKSPFVL